jgi:HAD superfamily hydrolase (TIGR01509 family)
VNLPSSINFLKWAQAFKKTRDKPMLQALIFDVDGTLADTEMAHLAAFNHAFKTTGMGWHWDVKQYTDLLSISGGKERLMHFWQQTNPEIKDVSGNALQETIAHLHELKSAAYEQAVQDGEVHMRPGVLELIKEAANSGLQLAIATTTSPVNIAALLRKSIGPDWMHYFLVVEDASTAPHKKPNPQVYLQTLARLKLPAKACMAFEDSENGLRAAKAAQLATLVTPNNFTKNHDFTGAIRVLTNLDGVKVKHLHAMHAAHPIA